MLERWLPPLRQPPYTMFPSRRSPCLDVRTVCVALDSWSVGPHPSARTSILIGPSPEADEQRPGASRDERYLSRMRHG